MPWLHSQILRQTLDQKLQLLVKPKKGESVAAETHDQVTGLLTMLLVVLQYV
jgi:hypothetical protein